MENQISKPFMDCVDICMQAKSDLEAKQLFWEAFKEKTGILPSKALASCTEAFLFNMDKNCFELKLLVPFSNEMFNSIISNRISENG